MICPFRSTFVSLFVVFAAYAMGAACSNNDQWDKHSAITHKTASASPPPPTSRSFSEPSFFTSNPMGGVAKPP